MNIIKAYAQANARGDAWKKIAAELRKRADGLMIEGYQNGGDVKKDVIFDGFTVGSFMVTKSSPTFEISDRAAFMEWAQRVGAVTTSEYIDVEEIPIDEIRRLWPEAVKTRVEPVKNWRDWLTPWGTGGVDENGEIVQGVEYIPQHMTGTRLYKCNYADVLAHETPDDRAALGEFLENELPSAARAVHLLGGGANE